MTKRKRPYVGIKFRNEEKLRPIYEEFSSAETPTETSHGQLYGAVIGPFRTKAGARFMAMYGYNNPHLQCVADAERMANKDRPKRSRERRLPLRFFEK